MNRIIVVAILLLSFGNFYATLGVSPNTVDSLKLVVDHQSGLSKYEPMIALVRELASKDYNAALEVAKRAHALSLQHGDSLKVVESARICGQLYNYLNRSNEAIDVLNSVLPLATRYKNEDYKKILNNLALAYTTRADYSNALSLHFKVLALNEDDKDHASIRITLSNIGHVYYSMRNYSEALLHFEKALDYDVEDEDGFDKQVVLTNIGLSHNQLGRFQEARHYLQQSLRECKTTCRSDIKLSALHGLGVVAYELGDYQDARRHFNESYAGAKAQKNLKLEAENLLWMAKIKISEKKPSEAIAELMQVEEFALEQGYTELLISIYKQLSEVYDNLEDYKNYSTYLEKYVELKDSIYDEHVLNNLAKAKADYEQRENLAIIRAKEMTIAQQHRFNIAVMIIAFLSGALVIVLYYNNNSIKKVNVELTTARDLIYDQNKELEIRNKELDRLVEKKTEELKLVNLSLKEMNDELNTFIYRTAQDIRGPLATLKGMCYVALMDIKDEMSLNYVNKINSTTDNLQTILKRLLIINSINSTKINPTVIDLKKLVDNVMLSQQRKGLPKNLLFRKKIAENAIIQCDQELLQIVLENSIENAVKYCNNSWGTEHFIEVDVAPGRNNRVSIRVTHNGIVTSEYNTDDIYEVFLDSMFSEPSESTRNDLYFVKTAAKKIGAKVEYKKTSEGYNELSVVF